MSVRSQVEWDLEHPPIAGPVEDDEVNSSNK